MRATINRADLVKALKTVTPAVSKAGGNATVLLGIRLEYQALTPEPGRGSVTLTASNLDLTVEAVIEVEDAPEFEPGVVIPPGALFARIVGDMGGATVSISATDHDRLTIESGETVAELHGYYPPQDWPSMPPPIGTAVELDARALDLLARVTVFASRDASRGPIQGVSIIDGIATATDSHRAALADLGVDIPTVILPAETLATILRQATAPVTLTVGPRMASFASGGVVWVSRLLEGEFPKIAGLLRDSSPHHLTFATAALLEALGRLPALAEGASGSPVVLVPEGGKVRLSAMRADVGTIKTLVACDGDFDEQVAYDGKYLVEIIKAAGADEITFGLVGPRKHLQIQTDLTLVLMPCVVTVDA